MMQNSAIAASQLIIWLADVVAIIVVWIIRLMCVIVATTNKEFIPKELLAVELAILAHLMLQPIVMLRNVDSLQLD